MYRKVFNSVLAISTLMLLMVVSTLELEAKANNSGKVIKINSVKKGGYGKVADFTYIDGGKEHSFSELTKGKVVFLNIWGTWCGPCKKEIPEIIEISKELKGKDFIVVGVSYEKRLPMDQAISKVKTFAKARNIPYSNFVVSQELLGGFGRVSGFPTTFIIDKKGMITKSIVGSQTKAQFMEHIKKVL